MTPLLFIVAHDGALVNLANVQAFRLFPAGGGWALFAAASPNSASWQLGPARASANDAVADLNDLAVALDCSWPSGHLAEIVRPAWRTADAPESLALARPEKVTA